MFLEQLVNGLAVGIIYALIAVGYSLIFGVLQIVNNCDAAIYTFGAFMAYVFIVKMGWEKLPGILVACVCAGVLGYLVDILGLKPLRDKGSDWTSAMISTTGFSYIITTILQIIFGTQMMRFPVLVEAEPVVVLGSTITSTQIVIAAVALIMMVALLLLINKTKIGLGMRAVCQSETAAAINGMNVNRIIAFTSFIASACVAVAGILNASYFQYCRSSMGAMAGLKSFTAAVLGGIGSLPGSIVGGLFIGVAESITVFLLGGKYEDLVAFSIMFLVLVIKPTGIFGKKVTNKV